jgi:chromosome segregation ATPase
MTTVDQALLHAIRGVVGEAVAPLSEKIDGLAERVDGLAERVDGLTERVDGLAERVDGLAERVDGLAERVERVETEQQLQHRLLDSIQEHIDERFTQLDLRLANLEGMSLRLENEIGTIETRTGQIYSDVIDLLELQDKVNEGFSAFRKDLQVAFIDMRGVQETQQGYQRQMKQLRQRVDLLERRLVKIESTSGRHE